MTTDPTKIHVEVAYALPAKQKIVKLEVPVGTTAREAVKLSHIESEFPGLNTQECTLGVFGHTLGVRGMASADEYCLKAGERVEIYRPLIADPKEVRKRRAAETMTKSQT